MAFKKYYFSANGKVRFSEKYAELASVVIEMEQPEEREGYEAEPKYNPDTGEGYWEYVKVELPLNAVEEQLKQLQQENAALKLAIAELGITNEQAKLETQLALAELAESLHGGDE